MRVDPTARDRRVCERCRKRPWCCVRIRVWGEKFLCFGCWVETWTGKEERYGQVS